MAARKQNDKSSIAGLLYPLAVAAGVAGFWFGLPGLLVAWVALLAVAFTEPDVVLTGAKKNGRSTPADDRESKKLERALRIQDGKATLLGGGLSDAGACSTAVAALLALAAFQLPVMVPGVDVPPVAWQVAQAASVLLVVTGLSASSRNRTGAPFVGWSDVAGMPRVELGAVVAAGLVGGAAAGLVLLNVANVSAAAQIPSRWPWLATWVLAGAILAPAWRVKKRALAAWKDLRDESAAWAERWPVLKLGDQLAPKILDTRMVGGLRVTTIQASGGKTSAELTGMVLKGLFAGVMPAGSGLWCAPVPDEVGGQPVPGTVHATKLRLVTSPDGSWPRFSDPDLDAELRALVAEIALWHGAQSAFQTGLLAGSVASCTAEDAPQGRSAWTVELAWPGADFTTAAQVSPQGAAQLTGGLLGDALLDAANGRVLAGDLSDEVLDEDARQASFDIQLQQGWSTCWSESLKMGTNPPVLQPRQCTQVEVGRATISMDVFAVRGGQDPSTLCTPATQRQLSTAVAINPMLPDSVVTITPWTAHSQRQGRRGDRHAQVFRVIGLRGVAPAGPQQMAPLRGKDRQANEWLLQAWINAAFDHVRQARPEIVNARPLTRPDVRDHAWAVGLRLYGGMSFGDVRVFAERLRQALKVDWLRVEDAADGCTLLLGGRPALADLADPDTDADRLVRLDWEQAFADAKIVNSSGQVPDQVASSVAPQNEMVRVLDFEVPPGLAFEDVAKHQARLRSATNNEFLELRRVAGHARLVRALACEQDPMPKTVPFDAAKILANRGLTFATGVDGSLETFDISEDPHLLVLGGSGSGKSAALGTIASAGLLKGWEWHFIDAVKKCADFRAIQPWVSSMSTDIFEAAGAIRGVYAEVDRRKLLNGQFGVTGCKELPPEHQVHQIGIVIDEFASLMMTEPVESKPLDDPIAEAGRQMSLARNAAARQIAFYVKKIAQEARSVNVTLVLAAQTLDATTLEKMGLKGLKTNMSSLLLGKTSDGARRSALKAPDEAAKLSEDARNGRGLFECATHNAEAVQVWWSHPNEVAEVIAGYREPLALEDKLDVAQFMPERPSDGPAVRDVEVSSLSTEDAEVVEVDLGFETAEVFADLDFGDVEDWSVEPDSPAPDDEQPREDANPTGPEPADGLDWDVEPVVEPDPAELDWESVGGSEPTEVDDLDWDAAVAPKAPAAGGPLIEDVLPSRPVRNTSRKASKPVVVVRGANGEQFL